MQTIALADLITPLLQLGAIGVVAYLMIRQNKDHQDQMAKRLGNLEDELLQTVQNNTTAMVSLRVVTQTMAAALMQRPCMKHDDALAGLQDLEEKSSA